MIAECRHCGEPFDYWEEGTKGWTPRQGEDICCPHCGQVHGQLKTIGYVRSRVLTADQRAAYERSKPGPGTD